MKVCIVGAGAIGGLIGGKLAAAGHEVSLIARGEHLAALRAHGLQLIDGGKAERREVRATDDPAALGPQDHVFITLKAYSIGVMLPRLLPLLKEDTAVITAINGIPWWYFYGVSGPWEGERIACLDPAGRMHGDLDARHLVGCVVHAAAEVVAPGVVQCTAGRGFILGEPDGRFSERLERVRHMLAGAGLDASVSARIRDDIWTKLIGNLSYNPVAALTGALMNEINDNPRLIALIRRMMIEGIAVAGAYDARVTVGIEERLGMARRLGRAKISMLQDLERGRALEIDAIVGAVTELGRRADVATPTIDGVEALLRERARRAQAR